LDGGEKFAVALLSDRVRSAATKLRGGSRNRQLGDDWTSPAYRPQWVIRLDWQAKTLAPELFPERAVNTEADRLADQHRKRHLAYKLPMKKRPHDWAIDPLCWKGMNL
jgi:hypothetical protein